MAVNEEVYGAKELWIASHGDASSSVNTIKIANYNLPSPNSQTRVWCQMYTNTSHSYTIYNNWDNRDNSFIDNSIVPFGIGSGSGLSNIDWYTVKNSVVSETPSNTDRRQITNIAYSYDDQMAASTWCLDGEGAITGGTGTAQTYNQRLCYNRWSNLYGTECSTGSSSAGGGSARFTTAWFNTRLFTYLPTKNLVLTPRATIVNSGGTTTTYTKISDIITHKNDGKLIRFGVKFSYKPTGARTDIPIAPFFMDDTNIQKGFANYPVPTGESPQIVNQAIKLPIVYNRTNTGFFILLGTGAYEPYINLPFDSTHHYTWATFQGNKIKFEPEIINSRLYMVSDISQLTSEEIEGELLTQMAYMGMLFVTDEANVAVAIYDEKMYCGEIKDGVTTGNYTHGNANLTQPQMQWDDFFQSGYDPYNPPTPVLPDNWSNTTDSPYYIGGYPLPNHWYITTPYALTKMLNAINDVDLETLDKNLTFGLNPIDGVLQIKHIYYNRETAVARTAAVSTSSINIGELQLQLSLLEAEIIHTTNINWIYTFDSVTSYPVGEPTPYNDFRSYMPYSSAAFYDAFCGIVEIDPAKILNKYISIRQTVDFLSGDKITSLYASEDGSDLGERIAVLTGNCSHDIPINGLQTADYARNKYMQQKGIESTRWERVSRIAMGLAGASISAMTENVIGAAAQTIGTMANSKILETQEETQRYLMEHTVPSVSKIQNGTPNVEAGVISGPTLFMYLPRMDENYGNGNDYKNLTGFSGYKVVKPSELSYGIHIFANPKISISGTKNEAIMLTDQLKKGIIIK